MYLVLAGPAVPREDEFLEEQSAGAIIRSSSKLRIIVPAYANCGPPPKSRRTQDGESNFMPATPQLKDTSQLHLAHEPPVQSCMSLHNPSWREANDEMGTLNSGGSTGQQQRASSVSFFHYHYYRRDSHQGVRNGLFIAACLACTIISAGVVTVALEGLGARAQHSFFGLAPRAGSPGYA